VKGRETCANVGQFTPLPGILQGPSGNSNLLTSSSLHVLCLFRVITLVLRCCHCLQGPLPRPDTRTNFCRCFLCSPLVSKHTTDNKWLLNLFISQPLSVLAIRGFTKEVAFYLQFRIIGLHFVLRITKPGQ
jgi:hypothetical protein